MSQLGRGGMAETWRARLLGEAGVTKPVLIKRVLAEYANDEAFISMFISEARISATLSHGNIAQVFDFGRTDGEYFLAMELVDGQPLHRVIRRALKTGLPGIPVPLATFIALEMCRGLHYAHTRRDEAGVPLGIVHRDISPDNVLIGYEGQVKIVDFGIAKARALRGFNTEPGVVKGKYLFFSPEQARGEEVDARTDVWATGIVLYEMLCGQLPVTGQQHTALPRLVKGQFARPRQLRPSLPAELDDIVMRALAVNREERYESCHAFGDALAGFLYSSAPRFSGMSVSYLLQVLFGEELKVEGRDVQVPRTFLEELSVWRVPESLVVARAAPPPASPNPNPGGEVETREAKAVEAPRSRRSAPLVALGLGGVLMCGLVGALVVAHQQPEPVEPPEYTEPRPIERKDREVAEVAPGQPPRPAETPPPASTSAATLAPPEEVGARSATYPVDSIRLDARKDLFRVSTGFAELAGLEPGETYTLTELGRMADAPPLFFLLAGEGLSANGALGMVPDMPVTVPRARAAMFFTVGPTRTRIPNPRRVEMVNVRTRKALRVTVRTSHARTSLERAFELKGLDTTLAYQLTLTSVGEGARVRDGDQGAVRKVACAREDSPDVTLYGHELDVFNSEQQFLVEEGTPVQVRGPSALRCGFIDDEDASDNQGEMELHITAQGRARGMEGTPPGKQERGIAKALYEHGASLLRQGHLPEAERVLKECVTVDPSFARCHMLLGSVAGRRGRADEGAKHYRDFLRLAPDDERAPSVRRLLEDYDRQPR
ncbi:MAG TPA: protein kinase [Archangium sp.]|uniref:protein kinase domain-containing protein n=1 Tax=Archangium sp. TaxID=1872627 RepID=UPI002ED9260E